MKLCKKCGVEKPLEQFYKRTYSSGNKGYRPYCKQCSDKIHEKWVHRDYGVDLSTVPPKPSHCELCERGGKICLDHDHATGKFRGWLCDQCNRGLGLLQDSPTLLRKATDYLERSK